jgi:putative transposase
MPHHIVQRGHNKQIVFIRKADYEFYLGNLIELKEELEVKIYAYCLMTNHIHLIVNPGVQTENVSELMKRLAGRQTRRVNKLEGRTGTLWEGRYKISAIESDQYLLQCCRYVELNPVKARMCERAEQYPWSSYPAKMGIRKSNWIDIDPIFESMGDSPPSRRVRYKTFVEDEHSATQSHQFIQTALNRNQLTGSNSFIDDIESRIGQRIEYRGRGRPVTSDDKK